MSSSTTSQSHLTPRQRRRLAREQSILDAAMDILVQEGLPGLTIQQLARAIDYTPGAVYRYFASKDAIFAALQVRTFRAMRAAFSDAQDRFEHYARNNQDLPESLLPLTLFILRARMYLTMPQERPGWFALVHLAVYEPRPIVVQNAIAQPVMEETAILIQETASLLGHVRAQYPTFCPSLSLPQAAVAVWMSIHGNLAIQKFTRFDPTTFETGVIATNLITTLLRGWGADPAQVELSRAWIERFETDNILWLPQHH